MTTKSQEEVRRLLALDVREVSMVDQAANLRKFAIIKRMEEEMGALESQAGIEQNNGELATDLATVAAFVEKAKKMEQQEEEMAKMVNNNRTFETMHKVLESYSALGEQLEELGTLS